MQYDVSHRNEKPNIDRVLSIINFILILAIIFCLNFMFINFLF